MTLVKRSALLLFFPLAGLAVATTGHAQATAPTASRKFQTSAFALFTGTNTGLQARNLDGTLGSNGFNTGITAGVDVSVWAPSRFDVALEVRGSYPMTSGPVVAERNVLGGARVAYQPQGTFATPLANFLTRWRPYADALFGRGQMDYQSGGYLVKNLLYTQTATPVYAGGGGLEIDLTPRFSFKADAQVEHWKTPVTTSGSILSERFGAGVTYRFGANQGPR